MASQVRVLAGLGSIFLLVCSCESPARVKPWRHAPDPVSEGANAPSSPALGDISAESEVRAARGHTLRIHLDAEPGRLAPLNNPSVWARRILLGPVYEPLIRYVPPEPGGSGPGRYEPRLARSWRVVTPPWGGMEVRIELEPNATFHDGHPLTSVDVQFTLDAIREPRRNIDHLRPLLDEIAAVELITPTEVRLVLTNPKPAGWVVRALAEIPIMPMHIYNDNLAAGGLPVGSGPYKVTSNKNGVVHLTRYEKYWAGVATLIKDVEFVYQPDAAIALKDAKRGDFDIIPALIPAHYPEQANAPGIAASFAPLELRPPRLRVLKFNAAKNPLDDVRVRHAIALLVDRKQIAERHFDRLARPVLWPIWPGGPVHGAEPTVPEFDPKAAGALLDAAGWTDSDKNGIRDRGGVELKLTMVGTERANPRDPAKPTDTLPREYLIEAARRIGVVIELKTGGDSWVAKRIEDGGYHLAEVQWNGVVDMNMRSRLGGVSPRIDRALDAMAGVWDPGERSKLASELAAALEESWPMAGIVTDAPQGLIHRRVQGVRIWDGWLDLARLSFSPPADKR